MLLFMRLHLAALLSLFILTATPVFAQDHTDKSFEKLERLMDERDNLLAQYERYEGTNSSFWGTKSKKDLRNIISTLKGIIRKDTEIVQAVRATQVNKESKYVTRSHFTSKRLNELEAEVGKFRSLAARRTKEIKDLEDVAERNASFRIKYHYTILISILLAGGMVFFAYKYISLLRNKSTSHSAA